MKELEKLIQCPKCYSGLQYKDPYWSCESCSYSTFNVDEIPWLFKDPNPVLVDWKTRFNAHLQKLADEQKKFSLAKQDKSLMKLSRQRMEELEKANGEQLLLLMDLLKPLHLVQHNTPAGNDLVNSVLPNRQQVETYGDNIFRDWCWGEKENSQHLDSIIKTFKPGKDQSMAVLGAGVCRLASDLHKSWDCSLTIAIDINPMLLMIAKNVMRGHSISLYEFPISPKSQNDFSVKQTLSEDKSNSPKNFHFLLADASVPPLHDQSVDIVLTPWFLDIIPQNADFVSREINRILKPGGHWIYFGSYFFDRNEASTSYSKEELLHLVTRNGFELENQTDCDVSYLQSPHSCQKRTEKVLTFSAKKVKIVEVYEEDPFQPKWFLDSSLSIPTNSEYHHHAFINQLHFEVLTQVDGQKSLDDLSKFVGKKYGLPEPEALGALKVFFKKLIEKGILKG